MLQRFCLNLLLFFIFALAQIGIVTHEISHLGELSQQHSKTDQKSTIDQCGQCIASAQAASGLPTQPIVVNFNQGDFYFSTQHVAYLASVLIAPYSARGPPLTLIS